MYKKFIKIIFLFLSIIGVGLYYENSFAGAIDIPKQTSLSNVSIKYSGSSDITGTLNDLGFSILQTVKVILQGLLILFLVYVGVQMIISMGDDKQLGNAKKQIMYSLIGLLFINIPGTLYDAFHKDTNSSTSLGGYIGKTAFESSDNDNNIFINYFSFGETFNDNILGFLKVLIFGIAVFMITYAGIEIMTSRERKERISEGKEKIIYSILALIFLGFIEAWKTVAFSGNISDGVNLFETFANLALFFAGPVAIFFLTIAGYYYITSNGKEERVKKAKSIVVNTILATLILLASYTFLLDLATL
ncbi:hypothetical protein HGA92_01485 [Candidatus Gracilibacteria bacterium]|nr:hypothetical protein [Candidatus Gracilibacteria bacterium]NUJ98719.1 hypothetical protein [Candidatus Gracilibacteria bacterium]